AFSPDGNLLVAGAIAAAEANRQNPQGRVKVWEVESWKELYTFAVPSDVYGVAFSPDGRRVAAALGDKAIRIWGMTAGYERRGLAGHPGPVHRVPFSPDGRLLAAASADHPVRIWEPDNQHQQLISTLRSHSAMAWGVAFSSDGKRL